MASESNRLTFSRRQAIILAAAGMGLPQFSTLVASPVPKLDIKSALRGLILFAITPMRLRNSKAEVDLEGVARNMQFFVSQPEAFSITVCGGTGEFYDLTSPERRDVIAAAAAEKKNRVLVAGVGGDTTKDAVSSAAQAEQAGADVLLVMPSEIVAKQGEKVLLSCYQEIARSVKIGVVPYRRPINRFGIDMILRLAELSNVIAVKDGIGDLLLIRDVHVRTGGRMPMFPAHERMVPFSHLAGAAGYTSGHANFVPRPSAKIWQLVEKRDYRAAMVLGDRFAVLDNLRDQHGNILLKAGLELRGLAGGPLRKGPGALSAEGKQQLKGAMDELSNED